MLWQKRKYKNLNWKNKLNFNIKFLLARIQLSVSIFLVTLLWKCGRSPSADDETDVEILAKNSHRAKCDFIQLNSHLLTLSSAHSSARLSFTERYLPWHNHRKFKSVKQCNHLDVIVFMLLCVSISLCVFFFHFFFYIHRGYPIILSIRYITLHAKSLRIVHIKPMTIRNSLMNFGFLKCRNSMKSSWLKSNSRIF